MPIYEYRCDGCGEMSEALQKVDEPPLEACPKCGQPTLKRVISATVFRLKGRGWYETDFKSGNRHNVYEEKATPTEAAQTGKESKSQGASAQDPSAKKTSDTASAAPKPVAEKTPAAPAKPSAPAADG